MKNIFFILLTGLLGIFACQKQGETKMWTEKQITFDAKNHDLDDNDNFSPDNKWLVYDIRDDAGIGANPAIEKVNVETGEMVTIYQPHNQTAFGPGCGAASYHPTENKVVFIHGLFSCSEENPYHWWRRFGMIVDESQPDKPIVLDARDVQPPTTPGALRGGTHRHEWSADGQWIGFTYNDALLAQKEAETGKRVNLRTLGVSHNSASVSVKHAGSGENFDGAWFSALIVQVVSDPEPGSDEISRADGDRWLGTHGYKSKDGTMQQARTFLGHVRDAQGNTVKEVYVVDVPERIDEPGDELAYKDTNLYIPKGVKWRRITRTAEWPKPGVKRVTSSPDGALLSFLATDAEGRDQLFLIPTMGGELKQVTHQKKTLEMDGGIRWRPGHNMISYVCDNTIWLYSVDDDTSYAITPKFQIKPYNLSWSHDGNVLAYNKILRDGEEAFKQVFLLTN
ncbi:MAG: DUF3748 domain-containing protein [Calditrichaeota bacterium]|nr:MAG: DUF3748 domain-containing protein [Calditrichota bacterium]